MSTASLFVSIIALGVSGFALSNSMRQRKIASESHRLNLYQRRFVVYERVNAFMDFMLESADYIQKPEFQKARFEMERSVKEAKFLFSEESGVPALIDRAWEMTTGLVNRARGGLFIPGPGQVVKKHATPATAVELQELQEQIETALIPYLTFHHISVDDTWGWLEALKSKFGRPRCMIDSDQLPFP